MSRKLRIIYSFSAVAIMLYLSFYIPYRDWKKNRIEHPDLTQQIINFKNSITTDRLSLYNIEYIKVPENITDLKLDQFVEALKKAKKGGYSHPVFFKHIIFTEKTEGDYYEIEVDYGKEKSKKWIAVTINVYNNEKIIDGVPFRADELEQWAYDVGLFD